MAVLHVLCSLLMIFLCCISGCTYVFLSSNDLNSYSLELNYFSFPIFFPFYTLDSILFYLTDFLSVFPPFFELNSFTFLKSIHILFCFFFSHHYRDCIFACFFYSVVWPVLEKSSYTFLTFCSSGATFLYFKRSLWVKFLLL